MMKLISILCVVFILTLTMVQSEEFGYGRTEVIPDTSKTYYPSSYLVVVGTQTSGINLGNLSYYDDQLFTLNEVGGSGIDLRVNFTNVTDMDTLLTRGQYSGNGNDLIVELWDYDAGDWQAYRTVSSQAEQEVAQTPILDPTEHIQNGMVRVRFRQVASGNPLYFYALDFVQIQKGTTAITSNEHDSLSGRNSATNHPWAVPKASIGTYETDPHWSANYTLYNASWSSTTNSSYYLKTNPFGFYNVTTLPATNPFDQVLNKSSNVTFNNTNISKYANIGSGGMNLVLNVNGLQTWGSSNVNISSNLVTASANISADSGTAILRFNPTWVGGTSLTPVNGIYTNPILGFNKTGTSRMSGIQNYMQLPSFFMPSTVNDLNYFGTLNEFLAVDTNATVNYMGTRNNLGASTLLGAAGGGPDSYGTFNRYGEYISGGNIINQFDFILSGSPTVNKYGIYLDRIGSGTYGGSSVLTSYDIYSNSGSTWDLHSDNQKFCMGASGCTDSKMYFDGTNLIINTTNSLTVYNSSGLGKIRALEYATSTPSDIAYTPEEKYIDTLPSPENLLDSNGKIRRDALRMAQTTWLETDLDRPVIVEHWNEVAMNPEEDNTELIAKLNENLYRPELKYEKGKYYQLTTETTYPYQKAVNVTLVDTQAFENTVMISELKAEIEKLKLEIEALKKV